MIEKEYFSVPCTKVKSCYISVHDDSSLHDPVPVSKRYDLVKNRAGCL